MGLMCSSVSSLVTAPTESAAMMLCSGTNDAELTLAISSLISSVISMTWNLLLVKTLPFDRMNALTPPLE